MALLGEVRVNGTYDGRKMNQGFAKSQKQATLFQKGLKGLTGAVGLLGGAFAAFKLVGFANNQRALIDDLAKTSRRLGLTTEALGAYQHAADLSGLSSGQLTTALEKMRDTIGAANLGEGTAIKAFEAIGLSVKEITAAEDPLVKIQQAISRIGDQNTKVAIVRDIFGRSGAQALNLFEQNLAGVRNEYERLGLSVSAEEAKKIEDFNDSLTKLQATTSGLGRTIIIDASSDLTQAVEGLQVIIEALGFGKKAPETEAAAKKLGLKDYATRTAILGLTAGAASPWLDRRATVTGAGAALSDIASPFTGRDAGFNELAKIQRANLDQLKIANKQRADQQKVVVEPANL